MSNTNSVLATAFWLGIATKLAMCRFNLHVAGCTIE